MVFLHDMACQMSEVLSNVTVDNGTTPSSQVICFREEFEDQY